ncbi:MAG: hypothetical protein ACK56I_33630, partial [bacterium]
RMRRIAQRAPVKRGDFRCRQRGKCALGDIGERDRRFRRLRRPHRAVVGDKCEGVPRKRGFGEGDGRLRALGLRKSVEHPSHRERLEERRTFRRAVAVHGPCDRLVVDHRAPSADVVVVPARVHGGHLVAARRVLPALAAEV